MIIIIYLSIIFGIILFIQQKKEIERQELFVSGLPTYLDSKKVIDHFTGVCIFVDVVLQPSTRRVITGVKQSFIIESIGVIVLDGPSNFIGYPELIDTFMLSKLPAIVPLKDGKILEKSFWFPIDSTDSLKGIKQYVKHVKSVIDV